MGCSGLAERPTVSLGKRPRKVGSEQMWSIRKQKMAPWPECGQEETLTENAFFG